MLLEKDSYQPYIEGLEATQATQFYKSFRHLDPATAEPDNSVPLVAGKPLAIRVYPGMANPGSKDHTPMVDGELLFCPAGTGDRWIEARRFPGSVPARPAESIDRKNPEHTLNFWIPGRFTRDALRIRARVWVDLPESGRLFSEWLETIFFFVETRPFRLSAYGIRYKRGEVEIPAPSPAEVLNTLAYVRKTYPISRIEILNYDTIDFDGDLTDMSEGGCGRGWNTLLLLLQRLRLASGTTDPHYAFLPAGIPNSGVGGCGCSLGIGASYVGDGGTLAQELGHIFGRRHTPGKGIGETDPAYPAYGRYSNSSIGEYGFDVTTGKVFSPASSNDFMSAGGNFWVSPYTYRGLLPLFVAAEVKNPGAEKATRGPGEDLYLYLDFSRRGDHRIELHGGMILHGFPLSASGRESSSLLELWDVENQVLHSQEIRLPPGLGEFDEEELHFLESIPLHPAARKLVIRCCPQHDPSIFEIPRETLGVEIVSPVLESSGEVLHGILNLRWNVVGGDADRLAFFLRFTCDGGRTWKPVNVGLEWRHCQVDLDRLPGGDACKFQVIASTILQTATAETAEFRVERKPRRAMVAGPGTVQHLRGTPVELIGTAHSPDGFAGDDELVWSSNLQGYLGKGSYLIAENLAPGEHEITLAAPDGLGSRTSAKKVVRIVKPAV